MIFHLTLKFSSVFLNNLFLNIVVASVVSYLKRELNLFGGQAQNLQCNKFLKRWLSFITNIVFTNVCKNSETQIKETLNYIKPIHFENKSFNFIHLSSNLHENNMINCLPESLQENKIPSTIYRHFQYHQRYL